MKAKCRLKIWIKYINRSDVSLEKETHQFTSICQLEYMHTTTINTLLGIHKWREQISLGGEAAVKDEAIVMERSYSDKEEVIVI